MSSVEQYQTVGRRKTSVARVVLRRGSGNWSVNGKDMPEYFTRPSHQRRLEEPFEATERAVYLGDGDIFKPIAVGSRPYGDGCWGHSDLAGNVAEWTLDRVRWPDPTPASVTDYVVPCNNCVDVRASAERAYRGGSYTNKTQNIKNS